MPAAGLGGPMHLFEMRTLHGPACSTGAGLGCSLQNGEIKYHYLGSGPLDYWSHSATRDPSDKAQTL